MSEIATNLMKKQTNQVVFSKSIGDYIYFVENNGFGFYRLLQRIKIESED
jgi:hypothetical protein